MTVPRLPTSVDVRQCPLCGAQFVFKPGTELVARDRATGEPVAICQRCMDVVESVQRAGRW